MKYQVTSAITDVRGTPDADALRGKFETQLVYGEIFIAEEEKNGWGKGVTAHDGYAGYIENPIRTLSVGYHTGYDNGIKGDHMLLNEIEVGACAKYPECQKLQAVDSTEVFKKKGLVPRYSTEGEYALEMHVPKACVVATYRIKFGKVDDKCYSDTQGNCNFGK